MYVYDDKHSPRADLAVKKELQKYNIARVKQRLRPLSVYCREESGTLVGGVVANCVWGWLHIDSVWVAEHCRGANVGRALLARIENLGAQENCHSAFLETYSFQAPEFYLSLGYEMLASLNNYADNQTRFFFCKSLRDSVGHALRSV